MHPTKERQKINEIDLLLGDKKSDNGIHII